MNWNNNSNLSSKTDIKSTNRRRKSCYVVVATLARWGIVLSFQAHTSLPFLPWDKQMGESRWLMLPNEMWAKINNCNSTDIFHYQGKQLYVFPCCCDRESPMIPGVQLYQEGVRVTWWSKDLAILIDTRIQEKLKVVYLG